MPKWDLENDGELLEEELTDTKEPNLFKVILLNDDYTTMDFVVVVLKEIFQKTLAESEKVMLQVHENGAGTAGIYTKDIAETKINLTHRLARKNQFPLRCTLEET